MDPVVSVSPYTWTKSQPMVAMARSSTAAEMGEAP